MKIGKRERVVDIRKIWAKEPEFSDWLASDEGISLIEQDLGISVENPRRESRPGDFPCDIVGNILGDENHIVVIENQFGRTNHDHLGKLLTYAAVHQAMTGVWIAETVSDDHRKVIDWLNDSTPSTVAFFLAELKAYQIGDSLPAPQLDVVCRPNFAVKAQQREISESDKERHEWQRVFWQEIHDAISQKKPPFQPQRPGAKHWSTISIGRAGFHLNMLLTPSRQSIGIDLYVQPDGWKEKAYQQLCQDKEAIDSEVGVTLNWKQNADKQSARILWEEKIDPREQINRKEVCDWFADAAPRMYAAFQKRVKALKAT